MIFIRGEKHRLRQQWHRWFAWHPVIVDYTREGDAVVQWLEWVERKLIIHYQNYWEYRRHRPSQ
jgi:hypothetical protein